MSFDLWLTFILTTFVLDLAPGPAVTLIIGITLGKSLKDGLKVVAALQIGELIWAAIAVAAILLSYRLSAHVMSVLTYGGSLYLVYLGLASFFGEKEIKPGLDYKRSPFLIGIMTQLANPKSYLYWLAFLPQFQPHSGPTLVHNMKLIVVVTAITLTTEFSYVAFAHMAKQKLLDKKWDTKLNRLSGVVLIIVGLWMIFINLTKSGL